MANPDNTTPHKAKAYDRSVRQAIPFYKTIQLETVDMVKALKPEATCWLDTGCGTGYLIESALPYFPETSFILTDPSEPMLKQAMKRLKGLPKKQVRYLPRIPSENLLTYKGKVHPDVITAILCHHYLKKAQRRQATEACFQLLSKGGIFITVENIAPDTRQGISAALKRWKWFQIEHGRAPAVVEEHIKRFNTKYFPITMEEHFQLLRETGFKVVELFWMSHIQAGFYAIK
jgi:tRNA (cmo5U34)-methyltransferase